MNAEKTNSQIDATLALDDDKQMADYLWRIQNDVLAPFSGSRASLAAKREDLKKEFFLEKGFCKTAYALYMLEHRALIGVELQAEDLPWLNHAMEKAWEGDDYDTAGSFLQLQKAILVDKIGKDQELDDNELALKKKIPVWREEFLAQAFRVRDYKAIYDASYPDEDDDLLVIPDQRKRRRILKMGEAVDMALEAGDNVTAYHIAYQQYLYMLRVPYFSEEEIDEVENIQNSLDRQFLFFKENVQSCVNRISTWRKKDPIDNQKLKL